MATLSCIALSTMALSTLALSGCAHQTSPTSATRPAPPSSPSAPAHSAERPLGAFTVTCHTGSGRTASGRPDGPGMVSVDPAVLPLGTKVRVEKFGVLTAADHGNAVDGRSLDVWTPSAAACTAFGRQRLQVWRLG